MEVANGWIVDFMCYSLYRYFGAGMFKEFRMMRDTMNDCESYCKPVKGNLKINMKKYCKKDYAIQVNVLDMNTVSEWAKFTVNIISVYKSRDERIKRADQSLWINMKDLACKCPKIQMSKKYLVMGNFDSMSERLGGLLADKNSLVIQWRDVWTRRLRKFQRKEKKGKCGKA